MKPRIYPILAADTAVKALFGTKPRAYAFSDAPPNSELPYATYAVFSAQPQNTMDRAPQIDNMATQIDVWATTEKGCQEAADAVRDALEPHGHMTNFTLAERDTETRLFRVRMDFDFFEDR